MPRLRNLRLVAHFAALALVLALGLQGVAMQMAMPMPDGICHAGDSVPTHQTPAQRQDCCGCLLCHAPATPASLAGPAVPLPRGGCVIAASPKPPTAAAPRPRPAFYASRAPPLTA